MNTPWVAFLTFILGGAAGATMVAWERRRKERKAVDAMQSPALGDEELTTLMGEISDAILAVDREGTPLFYNSRFALLMGKGKGKSLQKRALKLDQLLDSNEIIQAFRDAVDDGKTVVVKATPFQREESSKSFFSVSVAPLRRKNGEIYGSVGVFHDVTELKAAEQIRIDFVANVSHELRTPLTAIKGYTDTLLQDVKSGKPVMKEFLEVIEKNVERLMSLIGDLLDLSSLESSDVLVKTENGTKEVTARVLQEIQGRFDSKEQQVFPTFSASVVHADSKRLEQVLVNLLDNANKYTPQSGKVFLEWTLDGQDVLLKVKNDGPGIPTEHHARLFERFYRVDKARSRDQGGTGLGLAIVKHIMQRHDGAVWVESGHGRGATFVCRFPGGGQKKAPGF